MVQGFGPDGAQGGCRRAVELPARVGGGVQQDDGQAELTGRDGAGEAGGARPDHREVVRFRRRERHGRVLPEW